VAGVVKEFVPSADPDSPSITELQPVVAQAVLSSGNTLPTPVTITAAMTLDASRGLDVLEYLEGMRVSVPSVTVVAPTLGSSVNETANTQTSNGVLYGVVKGVARPFREAGVQLPDALPAGAPANVPRFDTNPERLRIDSDARSGAVQINANSGDLVTGMVGVLDYGFRTYTIYPDPGSATHVPVRTAFTPVPAPLSSQFTVASFNLNRLFDTVNDPDIGDPLPTSATYTSRLGRYSQAVRLALRNPDVLAVQEAENLLVLQDMATRILADGGPAYTAYLEEGNDPGGIDNGFLVKNTVSLVSVTQHGKDATYLNPANNEMETLHDRPALQLELQLPGVPRQRLIVINIHHRSLNGVDSTDVGSAPDNLATEGERVRAKRQAQAEWLANHVQAIQTATPDRRLLLVGDFNAFEVSDGFVDVVGTIKGTPAAADTVVLASPDLVNPDLKNLMDDRPATERYSYTFDGNAQTLDHALAGSGLVRWLYPTLRHARLNADFAATERNDSTSPERNSDHDPYVVYLTLGRSATGLHGSTATAPAATAAKAAPARARR
jgi:predicted extracellular nuclease